MTVAMVRRAGENILRLLAADSDSSVRRAGLAEIVVADRQKSLTSIRRTTGGVGAAVHLDRGADLDRGSW